MALYGLTVTLMRPLPVQQGLALPPWFRYLLLVQQGLTLRLGFRYLLPVQQGLAMRPWFRYLLPVQLRCYRCGPGSVACYLQQRLALPPWFGDPAVTCRRVGRVSAGSSSDTSVALEQEKYMSAVVAATPLSVPRRPGTSWAGLSDSSLSIDSLVLQAASAQPDSAAAAAAGLPHPDARDGPQGEPLLQGHQHAAVSTGAGASVTEGCQ